MKGVKRERAVVSYKSRLAVGDDRHTWFVAGKHTVLCYDGAMKQVRKFFDVPPDNELEVVWLRFFERPGNDRVRLEVRRIRKSGFDEIGMFLPFSVGSSKMRAVFWPSDWDPLAKHAGKTFWVEVSYQ